MSNTVTAQSGKVDKILLNKLYVLNAKIQHFND